MAVVLAVVTDAPRREGFFPAEMTAVLFVPCNGKFVTRRVLKSKKKHQLSCRGTF